MQVKKLRQLLSALTAVVMILTMVTFAPTVASADETTDISDVLSYSISDGEVTITDCDESAEGEIVIPDTIEGYPVTCIGAVAFYNCSSLTSVILGNNVTTVGEAAFVGCTSLTSVVIPDGVTSFEDSAFYGCDSLKSVEIPDSVTKIAGSVFADCTSLTSIVIPDSVTSIVSSAFDGTAYYDNDDNWENGVLYIGNCLMQVQDDTTECTIKANTRLIADYAFCLCTSLESVEIPDSVTNIGECAFEGCMSLESVVIPEGVTSLENDTFFGCVSLKSIIIPDGLTSIGDRTFLDCFSLAKITIPESIEYIGEYALGYFYDNGFLLYSPFTIYGAIGSETERYANENGISFNKENYASKFTDVKEGAWYYEAVNYALSNNLFNGMSATTFEPNTAMTRAMLVQVLYNMENNPDVTEYENKFNDVKEKDWYYNAVVWASNNGIVAGTTDTTFSPSASITREQLSAIVYRYANNKGYDVTAQKELSTFPDGAKASSYAKEALSWSVGVGLISGNKIGNQVMLDPIGNATRAQVALILKNFCEKVVE